jgi:hypothetical protein
MDRLAGVSLNPEGLPHFVDPGACPGLDPAFAGMAVDCGASRSVLAKLEF